MNANRLCEHCGAPLDTAARFCNKCGRSASASSTPTAAPARSGKPIWLIVGCIAAFVAMTCIALVVAGGFLFLSMNPIATPKAETVNPLSRGSTPRLEISTPLAKAETVNPVNRAGAIPIQINLTVPEGVQVIEKAAVLAPVPGAKLRGLNLGFAQYLNKIK